MRRYREIANGRIVYAVQFEGDSQIFPDLKLEPVGDGREAFPFKNMLWGHLETQSGRLPIYIGSWIVKNQACSILIYHNGDFQAQFEPCTENFNTVADATLTTSQEERIRQIVREEFDACQRRQADLMRARGWINPSLEAKGSG